MNKTNLLSLDTLKTMGIGALGAIIFGIYHLYTTNKIIELNNTKRELQFEKFMDKMDRHRQYEIDELKNKINKLEQ